METAFCEGKKEEKAIICEASCDKSMRLHLQEYGHGGTPLVILHGLFGEGSNWQHLAAKLSSRRKVLTIDMPNHGKSPHLPEIMHYDSMAEALHTTLNQYAPLQQRWILLGHSMGGKVAMRYAQLFPHLVERLLVVDIAPKPYQLRHLEILEGMQAIARQDIHSRAQADDILQGFEENAVVRAFLLKNLLRSHDGTYHWKLNLPSIVKSYEHICSWIMHEELFKGPCIFIYGAASSYVHSNDESLLRRIFPHAEMKVIANAGHWLHAEYPIQFLQIVEQFLDSEREKAYHSLNG